MACKTIVSQLRLIDLWLCTCHTNRPRKRRVRLALWGGGKGGWGYRVHRTVHMYSIICTMNSIRGRGKGKISYKLAIAQLLQFLVLAYTNLASKFLQYKTLKHNWAMGCALGCNLRTRSKCTQSTYFWAVTQTCWFLTPKNYWSKGI